MPIDFPTSPVTNDTYTFGSYTWQYNGYGWQLLGNGVIGYTGSQGDLGYTGSQGYTGSASTVIGYTGSKGDIGYTGSTPTGAVLTETNLITQPAIANTETVVTSFTAPANTLTAGMTIRTKGFASRAGATGASGIARLRIGTTTLTGNITSTVTATSSATAATLYVELVATILTTGATGTTGGGAQSFYNNTSVSSITTSVTVNTTVSNLVELTFISGSANNTYTFRSATIEVL
jgi:hypothetical protein